MTTHTSRTLGTCFEPGIGMCNVEQLKPGSAMMRLIPIEYHDHYSNSPLIRYRDRLQWRSHNIKENAA